MEYQEIYIKSGIAAAALALFYFLAARHEGKNDDANNKNENPEIIYQARSRQLQFTGLFTGQSLHYI